MYTYNKDSLFIYTPSDSKPIGTPDSLVDEWCHQDKCSGMDPASLSSATPAMKEQLAELIHDIDRKDAEYTVKNLLPPTRGEIVSMQIYGWLRSLIAQYPDLSVTPGGELENVGQYEETILSTSLGSCFNIMPSGKYYTPWAASNLLLCPMCAGEEEEGEECPLCEGLLCYEGYADNVFHEVLDAEAETRGMWVANGDGDPTDMFVSTDIEPLELLDAWASIESHTSHSGGELLPPRVYKVYVPEAQLVAHYVEAPDYGTAIHLAYSKKGGARNPTDTIPLGLGDVDDCKVVSDRCFTTAEHISARARLEDHANVTKDGNES